MWLEIKFKTLGREWGEQARARTDKKEQTTLRCKTRSQSLNNLLVQWSCSLFSCLSRRLCKGLHSGPPPSRECVVHYAETQDVRVCLTNCPRLSRWQLCVWERVGVRGRWAQLLLWMTRNLRRATKMTLFSWIYRTREGFTFLLHFGYTLTSLRNTRKVSQCRQEFSNKNCSVNKRCEMLMYRLLFGREIRSTIIRNGVRGLLRSTIDGWALRCLFDEGVGESGSQWKY